MTKIGDELIRAASEASAMWKALLERSNGRWAEMTNAERQEMIHAQRESWMRGMARCEHGVADWESCPECRGRK